MDADMRRWHKWAITIVVAVGLIVWVIGSSQSFQDCMNECKNQTSEQAFQKGPTNLFVALIRGINLGTRCIGAFIDKNYAAITALATIVIAAFTGTLWLSTITQARITEAALKLATDEFNITHRPKLRVRTIRPHFTGGEISVHYTLVNIGGTLATIKEHAITLCVQSAKNGAKAIQENLSLPCPELKAGQSEVFLSPRIIIEFGDAFDIKAGGALKIRGTVKYEDVARTTRRTGFLRTYDDKLGRFCASDDEEEEYED